jgi:hypothetical protein
MRTNLGTKASLWKLDRNTELKSGQISELITGKFQNGYEDNFLINTDFTQVRKSFDIEIWKMFSMKIRKVSQLKPGKISEIRQIYVHEWVKM